MSTYISTLIGRLRLIAFLEGISLIILVLIAVPLKYYFDFPLLVKVVGPIHGVLFLGFVFYTVRVSLEEEWKFWKTTWKVLLSSLIPFGTFYIDRKILRGLHDLELAR
ncbi:MAG: DUF3817 domain-containing protein [Saprospiraceae bacterium]|nr:DUF3817 domain-containing protein [Saprospiraceae bacterium]